MSSLPSRTTLRRVAAAGLPAAIFALLSAAHAAPAGTEVLPEVLPEALSDAGVQSAQLTAAARRFASGTVADAGTPARHSNAEHPGVLQWRQAQAHGIALDPNQFLVQPPASTRWTLQPQP